MTHKLTEVERARPRWPNFTDGDGFGDDGAASDRHVSHVRRTGQRELEPIVWQKNSQIRERRLLVQNRGCRRHGQRRVFPDPRSVTQKCSDYSGLSGRKCDVIEQNDGAGSFDEGIAGFGIDTGLKSDFDDVTGGVTRRKVVEEAM